MTDGYCNLPFIHSFTQEDEFLAVFHVKYSSSVLGEVVWHTLIRGFFKPQI
jgi:hypothetical protein